ncbi:hypothetical protein Aasi_1304 [Candidatus Amoebophilus asiaticus 5a2]|uniref:Protein kinase domain-containing protein n=1 Tax=Amoebophilus asiaticus (strain 5a2) TaxID=452471 RepID=B3ETR4_AMOA5|nr:tetratricopeptide repeat protein [Candidatus Amoebophilus asiaticus]ACE06616.1 hypothetical protein Aasi_1304 [Candidatus Amoebophilus asiaticus 5a2]
MKRTYTLFQQYIAYALLVSYFLQSCGGLNNPVLPIKEDVTASIHTPPIIAPNIQTLVDQTLTAQGGHAVTLYEDKGQLQASVEIVDEKSKVFNGIAVSIEKGTDLRSLAHLPKRIQQYRIQVEFDEKGTPVRIGIHKPWLMGGMERGEDEENNDKEKKGMDEEDDGEQKKKEDKRRGKKKAKDERKLSSSEILAEFISNKGEHYQVFKEITLEMAEEVQKQTGLVIPFKPGQNSKEFVGGKGSFGELRLGKQKTTERYFGIKVIDLARCDSKERKRIKDEAILQEKLSGLPNLMSIIDIGEIDNKTSLCYVMPLAALGSGAKLKDYLKSIKDKAFKEALLVHIAKGILNGFKGMHNLVEPPIAHLDFKPDNLVIDSEGEIYIIDFGCSQEMDPNGKIHEYPGGTERYCSPERTNKKLNKYKLKDDQDNSFSGKAADSWAIGITLLEMITGDNVNSKNLLNKNTNKQYLSKIGKTHNLLADDNTYSYASMVKSFLNPDEKERLTPEEALTWPLFQQETEAEILNLLKEFVQTIQRNKGITSAQQLPLPHFTGYVPRLSLEQDVIDQLLRNVPLVACIGIGGVGKSQLLTYLVHHEKLQQAYKIYWFQSADKESALLAQYHGLAQELKLVDEKTPAEVAKTALLSWLEKQGNTNSTLLVFDNADDPNLLKTFLPKGGCQSLVSSRSPNWENKVPIGEFTELEVYELLAKLLPDRDVVLEEAKLLGEELGYLPLALKLAIAWMRQEGISIKEYLEIYKAKKQELLKTKRKLFGNDLPHSMVTLYQIQIEKLKKECPEAIILLEYTSLLAPDDIPLALLGEGLLAGCIPDATYKKAQQALLSYALWQEDKGIESVRIHRLMQEVTKLSLDKKLLKERLSNIISHITNEFIKESKDVLADEVYKKTLGPHLEALEKLLNNLQNEQSETTNLINQKEFATLITCIARYHHYQGINYKDALIYYQKALEMYRTIYTGNHPDIASSLDNIGNVYYDLIQYQEALKYYEQAFEIKKTIYKDTHPSVATSLNNIGNVYRDLGRRQDALNYLKRALAMRQALYTGNHPDIANSLNSIGMIHQVLGENQEALKYYEQALKMRQAIYTNNHPDIASSLHGIGTFYCMLKADSKALPYFKQALEIYKAIYTDKHPKVAYILNNIGIIYQSSGDYSKALQYLEDTLTIYKVIYSDNHPHVASVLQNIGGIYNSLTDYTKAVDYLIQALKMKKAIYAGNHPFVATALDSIGIVYHNSHEYEKALEYYEEALKMRQALYKGNHPDIVCSLNNIGNVYSRLVQHQEALKYYQQAPEMGQGIYTNNHPDIVNPLNNIEEINEGKQQEIIKKISQAARNVKVVGQNKRFDINGVSEQDVKRFFEELSITTKYITKGKQLRLTIGMDTKEYERLKSKIKKRLGDK